MQVLDEVHREYVVKLMSHEETKMSLYRKQTSAQQIFIAVAPVKSIALCRFTSGEDQALCLQKCRI